MPSNHLRLAFKSSQKRGANIRVLSPILRSMFQPCTAVIGKRWETIGARTQEENFLLASFQQLFTSLAAPSDNIGC